MIADGMDPFLENEPIEEQVIERTGNNSFEIINQIAASDELGFNFIKFKFYRDL